MILLQGYKVQTMDGGHWGDMADSLTTDLLSIPAERGNVYSSDGHLLATSLPYFELRLDLASPAMTDDIFYQEVDLLAEKMAEDFKQKSKAQYRRDLIKARRVGNRYYLIKRDVDYNQLKEIKTWPLFKYGKYKGGLIVITKQTRKKPYGVLAERTIGYVRNNAQDVGLEAQYDEYLSGREGRRLMQRIAGGHWIPLTDENAIDPKNGKDIVATIDIDVQDVAESALMRTMRKYNAEHGCVAIMEVETGAIKAIANLGKLGEGVFQENYNYAIGRSTEPGSTFKVASFLAMLEEGCVTPTDSISVGQGSTTFYGYPMKDVSWKKKHLTSTEVLARSSNVGTAKMANNCFKHNRKAFYEKLEQYHLTEATMVGIPGEPDPIIAQYDKWSKLSVPWISTGYEIRLTPLQVLKFYNAIANDGRLMKPYLVEKIMDYGNVVKEFKPVVLDKKIATDKALDQIQIMLENVVEKGTAKRVKSPYYKVAGKTGTAKFNDPDRGYIRKYQASFAGYFPADNPKYSGIVVVVSRDGQLLHGGEAAAPVFKEVADRLMAQDLDMKAPVSEVDSSNAKWTFNITDLKSIGKDLKWNYKALAEGEYMSVEMNKDGVSFSPLKVEEAKMPDVRGMFLDDALYLLENLGCSVVANGKGKVARQSVKYGTKIEKGLQVKLILN